MKKSIKILFSLALVLPMMAFAMINNPNDATNMNPVGDDIEAGKALFQAKACFACHGMNAEGNALGPNMTDNFTKHGCSEEEIISVINKGVAGTAMVPYEAQLKPEEVKALAKFIVSLKGSNPANAKAAEGEECK
ncbi:MULTISPECIES: c-type cytochrome [unclassified Lentimicrobium]|uniref:c-type cytochrome n=1 Tax=unclassified Lentimicrobium TaxID=2677434 RepID=UPI001553D49E|nr:MULTISPECIES: c-type cytochrome [unclassified Lentimicrobium]NPD47632.1 cytochrome c [Lentimicrobium sp. S6]NPD86508.1 cytochrome c [Lentimicrobium sp. L6]